MNIIKLYLLFILSLLAINTYSQVNKDSLLIVWENETLPDSIRLAAIDKAAWHGYLFKNPDSAFYYAQLQYDYSAQVGNKVQMGNALNTQGVSYSMRDTVLISKFIFIYFKKIIFAKFFLEQMEAAGLSRAEN